MGKKNHKKNNHGPVNRYVEEIELEVECTNSMQVFYANTNLMRQISNLVDGLKPAQRRILVSMYDDLGLRPGKKVKSASIVARTMENYHPHGDISIYGTLTKMAQWWSTRYVMAKPMSNFGTQSGAPASAMRYTDTTLTTFAMDAYFSEYNLDDIPTKLNYDRTINEPEYLPAKYPMALLLGCFGIGQGIQVGIPPFRPDQVFDKAIELIDNPSYNDALLMPDSATFCDIIDDGTFEEFCRTGNGKIRYRSSIKLDKKKNEVHILTLPPQVTMKSVSDKIIDLHEKNILKGYINNYDDPDLSPAKLDGAAGLIVKFRREIDLEEVVPILLKYAGLTKSIGVNFVYLDNYSEVTYGVIDYLKEWLEYRREYKQISYSKKLINTSGDIHTLETVLSIFDGKNAEKALKVARTSRKADLIEYLMKEFDVTSMQARAISNMSISAFTPDNIEKLKRDLQDMYKIRKEYKKILANDKHIDKIIKEELIEGRKKYGGDIRCNIVADDGGTGIPNTRHMLVTTKEGYVKKLPHSTENIGFIAEGDIPNEVTFIDNRDDLMIFTSSGKVFKLPVSKIQSTILDEPGIKLSEYVNLKGDVIRILPKPNKNLDILPDTTFVVMMTEEGLIKKTDVLNYTNMRSELNAMTIGKDDNVVDVKLMVGHAEIIVYTDSGMGVRYITDDIRETGRAAKGIIGIGKDPFDKVKGFDIVNEKDKFILCITNKGKVKRCDMSAFKPSTRTSKALRLITLDAGEEIALIQTIRGKEEIVFFMKSGVMRFDSREVLLTSRIAKGDKLVPVKRGDNIIDVRVN